MFTGIIEELGKVKGVSKAGNSMKLTISATHILEDVKLGDSIAVNGICLTVTDFTKTTFTVDVMPETVYATSLQTLVSGKEVNVERAMPANGRFGGHFVTGHVDGTGTIVMKKKEENAVYYEIEIDEKLMDLCVERGSIAIDGTSLTIFAVTKKTLVLSLIPHTLVHTVIGQKGVGDIVNIETDILGKYIRKGTEQKGKVTASFLQEHGFC